MLAFLGRNMAKSSSWLKPVALRKLRGRYLTHQEGLPHLPVPPLQQTLDRYLLMLEPIISEEELSHTKDLVRDFRKPGDWWLKTAYLEYRLPVVIHSSPGVVLPKQDFLDRQGQLSLKPESPSPPASPPDLFACDSFRFAAKMIEGALDFKTMVDNETLPVEYLGGKPLCMNQYYQILSSCRIPGPKHDSVESVRTIEKSIFTVCLDAPIPRVSDDIYNSRVAAQMLHGGGSRWNSGNRWFDKTLQFIVAEDGSCGLMYEHAPSEGPPIVALLDHIVEYTKKPELVRSPMIPLPMPKKLRFNITPEIKNDIENAKQNLNIMVQDLDIKVIVFHQFGKNFPKSEKISPDAFIQIALQLAYYRMYGELCSTYESASLRMFRLGRTDTIRSTSVDALKFVQSMTADNIQAIRGNAIDRHLLGLKLQAIEDLVSIPELFMDTAYAVAMHFNLSTSQVSWHCHGSGPWGLDGYGVCYNPMEEHINFAISAFNSCSETNAARLAHYLEQALLDMRLLLQSTPKSKL
ncbi:hypothetical protein Chor_002016 [Crotalus horridus]